MGNPVVHWELWSKDPEKVSAFYASVFDWKVQHIPELSYHMVQTEGGEKGIDGGIMKPDEGPLPGNMAFYIDVDDLAAYRTKIVEAGGQILVEEQEIPGIGSFTLFSDPEGRVNGMWKQNPQAHQ